MTNVSFKISLRIQTCFKILDENHKFTFLSGNFPPIYSFSPPLSFSLQPNTRVAVAKHSLYVMLRQGIGFPINVRIEKPFIDLASLQR